MCLDSHECENDNCDIEEEEYGCMDVYEEALERGLSEEEAGELADQWLIDNNIDLRTYRGE